MPGAYIGPAAKATAAYLRYQLNVPDGKISQFFSDFFGLKFRPSSTFEGTPNLAPRATLHKTSIFRFPLQAHHLWLHI